MKNPVRKKKISLFNMMVALFIMAAVIVFFVYNIIVVNQLVISNSDMQNEISKYVVQNNALQTEIERLSNFDNIKPVAVDKLNMGFSQNRPKKITVKKSDLEN